MEREAATDDVRDVAVVGGGPAGCSAAVFTARYGLDTVVLDGGSSSLRRCAHLENFLGFPAGIDVGTFYDLIHDHVEGAGGDVVLDPVESVERADGDKFTVVTREDRRVRTRRVVAATRYDGDYLGSLVGDEAFLAREHAGEERETFDRSYPDHDGRTPVEGLFVASPSEEADRQAIVAAGRGARVGLAVVEDVRRERGYPEPLAPHYDWVRHRAELTDEWADRDRWREWFDERLPGESTGDDDRLDELREREIDRRFETYLPREEVERRAERGQRRLLEHVDDDLVLRAAEEIRAGRGTAQEATDR